MNIISNTRTQRIILKVIIAVLELMIEKYNDDTMQYLYIIPLKFHKLIFKFHIIKSYKTFTNYPDSLRAQECLLHPNKIK